LNDECEDETNENHPEELQKMDTKQIAKNKANIQLGSCPEKSAWFCFFGIGDLLE